MAESDEAVVARNTSVEWYAEGLDNVSKGTRDLLERYSQIAPDRVIPHCLEVRERAWQTFPYPCIGQFRFLDLSIGLHPAYPEISARMNSGTQTYLDLGCCFGQDIRRLVHDGAPATQCYGADLRMDFMELGYDLFLDKATLASKFIAADVFDADSDLKQLDGQVDIMHAASLFHLFELDQQYEIARRVARLLKPRKDSLLVGRQVGNVKAGRFPHRTNPSGGMFRHDAESWTKMWENVGEEMGIKFGVDVQLLAWPGNVPSSEHVQGMRRLQFAVRRL